METKTVIKIKTKLSDDFQLVYVDKVQGYLPGMMFTEYIYFANGFYWIQRVDDDGGELVLDSSHFNVIRKDTVEYLCKNWR